MLELLFGIFGVGSGYSDTDLMPDVDVWRSLHPTEFNPYDSEPWGSNEYAQDDNDDDW